MSKLLDHSIYATELKLEGEAVTRGVLRYRRLAKKAEQREAGASLKPAERLLAAWFTDLRNLITAEKRAVSMGISGLGRRVYGKYLKLVPSDVAAVLTMHSVISRCIVFPLDNTSAAQSFAVGRAMSAQHNLRCVRKAGEEAWHALVHTDRKRLTVKNIQKIARKYTPETVFPLRVQAYMGATLVRLMERAAWFKYKNEMIPAIQVYMRRRRRRTVGHIRLTRPAQRIIEEGHAARQFLRPVHQPMVVRPMRWGESDRGGYLHTPTELIKGEKRKDRTRASAAARRALNALARTAWRVNAPILAVAEKLATQGGNCAGLPRTTDIPLPPLPPGYRDSAEVRKAHRKIVAPIYRANAFRNCAVVTLQFKLDVARRMKEYARIYFPHEFDFRSRVYPVPLFLNHYGDDLCRGLLQFARPVPVAGEDGRRWLYLHLASCCGIDKASHDARIAWVEGQLAEISGWSNDPLAHQGWMDCDKPWQALAASIALSDPEAAARLPIQVDGSNNALQHYSAMLRCPDTAALCNLMPAEVPADVYSDIAVETARRIDRRAGKGDEIAAGLQGWITRKIVKQPTMTTVYGVTKVGMRRQLHHWLHDAGFPEDELYNASRYLAGVVKDALGAACPSARAAMKWLSVCARNIAESGETVRWNTPLGFHVEQPYRNTRSCRIRTILHALTMRERVPGLPVRVNRQANAFAPNWIHSIDASHMMSVAVEAEMRDMTFAAVHDCFWTHAERMEELGVTIREQFIKLHAEPLHCELHGQLTKRYPRVELPDPPEVSDLDLSQVMDSKYFFS